MWVQVGGGHLYEAKLEPIHKKDKEKYWIFTTTVKYRWMIFGMVPIWERYVWKITTVLVNPADKTDYFVEQE